ncbi:hypothetical protein OROMI_026090 [Orobanche minor]
MVLTVHFIDAGWTLHKRIINFCVIPNHKGTTIGKILESCLLRWRIDKVLTISVDNASANKVAVKYIQEKMASWKEPPVFEGQYLHVRCLAHILNIIVKAGLSLMDKSCAAIRNAVKYIRSSPNRLDVFKVCMEKEKLEGNIDTEKVPALDLPTRWNSTFLMLDIATDVKPAFQRMEAEEMNKYRSYFDEDDELEDENDQELVPVTTKSRKRVGPPQDGDWEKAEIFVINALFTPTAGTANEVQLLMLKMADKIMAKFRKYFGRIEDMNQLLLIALVLDPRFKLKNISHTCLQVLNYTSEEAKAKITTVKELLVSLTDIYRMSANASSGVSSNAFSKGSTATSVISSSSIRETASSSKFNKSKAVKMSGKMADLLEGWQKALADSHEVVCESEVDRYLLDPIEVPPKREASNWCLLSWWKINGCKYPNLALVAKDVLAIQVSTVASESSFSTGAEAKRKAKEKNAKRKGKQVDLLESETEDEVMETAITSQPKKAAKATKNGAAAGPSTSRKNISIAGNAQAKLLHLNPKQMVLVSNKSKGTR